MPPLIEVENLSKNFGPTQAIEGVSFSVEPGEVLGFLGPNGAGKTTTMRILAGSLAASEGSARIGGLEVSEHPREVKRRLGYLPEQPPLYGNMVVEDYVAFAARIKGVEDVPAAVDRVLERVGLSELRGRIVAHLSKGYRQRVGLAQALVHDPDVLILDEPTSGLDPAQRVEIRELIRELAAGERTVILSTHVLPEVEKVCERVVIIDRGRVVAQDRIDALAQQAPAVRLRVERPGPELVRALAAVEGVRAVEPDGPGAYLVRAERDLRAELARVAVDYGLLELSSRERLEDVYLRYTSGRAEA